MLGYFIVSLDPRLQSTHSTVASAYATARLVIRTVVIAKDDLFALPENIVSYLGSVLAKLPAERHLRGLTRAQVIDRLTYYLAEINATHPFREGNGRAQRAFVAQLAADAGYRVDWRRLDPQRKIRRA